MPREPSNQYFDRRQFVAGAAAVGAAMPALLTSGRAIGQEAATAPTTPAATSPGSSAAVPSRATFDELYAQLTKGTKPTEGKMRLDVPEIAENGNTVPFLITADSPMTAENHVKSIHLLSTENPQAGVAAFHFSPTSGKAVVSSRMRLSKSQDIVALAELSDGKLWVARTKVTVTIGGCGG